MNSQGLSYRAKLQLRFRWVWRVLGVWDDIYWQKCIYDFGGQGMTNLNDWAERIYYRHSQNWITIYQRVVCQQTYKGCSIMRASSLSKYPWLSASRAGRWITEWFNGTIVEEMSDLSANWLLVPSLRAQTHPRVFNPGSLSSNDFLKELDASNPDSFVCWLFRYLQYPRL